MQGIELARDYFDAYGEDLLKSFPEALPHLAVGLVGSGSECFGFDDDISQDHDFEPGFCIFLPDETIVDRKTAFQIERAYAKLPRSFMGWERLKIQPVGGPRHGVIRIGDFLSDRIGKTTPDLSLRDWISLPEQSLAECTNGSLFFDHEGLFSAVREKLHYLPEDVRLKKLAGCLLLMGQSGQYNYARCLKHGETGAAQLALFEFVQSTIHAVFLLNRVYLPYYKWSFKACSALKYHSDLVPLFELLIETGNEPEQAEEKQAIIESIASDIIDSLHEADLTEAICQDLEKHAYSVHDRITDAELRNMHILAGV
ncbi:MAG: DUF4037 domain-containing protein [Clostridia bacterium]|nr:DUF4037 domain-containing protein [Clostridia bacterium]